MRYHVGDKVKYLSDKYGGPYNMVGTVIGFTFENDDIPYLVEFPGFKGHCGDCGANCWWCAEENLSPQVVDGGGAETMIENYAVINGKRIELTDEQVKTLGIETRKNPFERVAKDEVYSLVGADGYAVSCHDDRLPCDNNSFLCHNYFNDKAFANQIALHQLLYRKLLKFSYDNGCEDTAKWDCENRHWCIRYDHCDKVFGVTWYDTFQYSSVYFPTMESAERAIEEVVKPFMKEHPDFVW